MATIKSYSDLEQSKKLAEILSLESADMYYPNRIDTKYQGALPIEFKHGNPLLSQEIAAWSLAALLGVLPKEYTNSKNQVCTLHIDIVDSETPYLMWYANPEHEGSIVEIKTEEYSNLVDACYEMVIKLHEQNII